MSDENIESRLCAYIDGLLNEQEREEIEQYLDRYPEHRQLIDELIRQRAELRDLPRDRAPGEVLAQYQNQLERSVLLGDLSDAGSGRSRRRRLNWAAIAAVILLAAGASVVVWIAMPPKRGGQIASTELNSAAPTIEAMPGAVAPEVHPIVPATAPTLEVAATPTAASPMVTMGRSLALAPAAPSPHAEVIDTGTSERTILMIHSDDLPAARRRVQEYLESNSLVAPATEPASTQEIARAPEASEAAIVVNGMTRAQAAELAREFSITPATARSALSLTPATMQVDISMNAAVAAIPATQTALVATSQPASRPASEVTILFQKITPVSAAELPATEPVSPPATQK